MSDAIIVAIVGGLFSIIGIVITSNRTKKDILAKMEMQFTVQDEQIKGELQILKETTDLRFRHMDEKLDEYHKETQTHNNFARRMPVLEEKVANLEKKVS